MPEVTGTAIIKRAGLRRARRGQPHLLDDDIVSYIGDGGPFVDLVDDTALPMGTALYEANGRARVRLLSSARTRDPVGLLLTRLERAIARRRLDLDGAVVGRLVHGDADGVPGLLVDRFASGLLVVVTSGAMASVVPLLLPALVARTGTRDVVLHDVASAAPPRVCQGSNVVVYPHGRVERQIDLCAATSLDVTADLARQENLRRWARGRVVDIYAGHGGYGVQLCDAGAAEVTFVDTPEFLSPSVIEDARQNGIKAQLTRVEQDGVAWLEGGDHGKFDVVVFHPRQHLEPDAHAASAAVVSHALLCVRLLEEGGILAASPAVLGMSADAFVHCMQDAAADTRRRLQILARLEPGPDRPVLAGTHAPAALVVARVLQTA